jgi:nucleotide-binding universal stress UspA family protein
MFKSVVVPVEPDGDAEHAVAIAEIVAGLARVPLELVTVVAPGADLGRPRVAVEARARRSPVACTATVAVHVDVAAALVDHLRRRPGALLVLATRARGPLSELLLGSVSEELLARADRPVLLVGPKARGCAVLGDAAVAAVADLPGGEAILPWVADWVTWIGGDAWVVQVGAPGGDGASALVQRLAGSLRDRGVPAQWDVLHRRSVPEALVDFTASMGGGVVLVASQRWTDPDRIRWSSTARALVHRSPFPVLVVPVHQRVEATVPGRVPAWAG